jgi:hypothetical protein
MYRPLSAHMDSKMNPGDSSDCRLRSSNAYVRRHDFLILRDAELRRDEYCGKSWWNFATENVFSGRAIRNRTARIKIHLGVKNTRAPTTRGLVREVASPQYATANSRKTRLPWREERPRRSRVRLDSTPYSPTDGDSTCMQLCTHAHECEPRLIK